jgi:hypothetical protein
LGGIPQDGFPEPDPSGLDRFLKRKVSQVLAAGRIHDQRLVPPKEQVQSGLGLRPEARFSLFFAFHGVPPVFSLEIHAL